MTNDVHPRMGQTTPEHRVRSDGAHPPIPHTQVHALVRRTLEHSQDVIASLLILLLFVLSLQALWRLARMAFDRAVAPAQLLSEVMFVLILTEVYRLLIFYLREHQISVTLAVEVALVSALREVMFRGAHEFDALRLVAISLLLVVLGALLAAERWRARGRNEAPVSDAR